MKSRMQYFKRAKISNTDHQGHIAPPRKTPVKALSKKIIVRLLAGVFAIATIAPANANPLAVLIPIIIAVGVATTVTVVAIDIAGKKKMPVGCPQLYMVVDKDGFCRYL